MILKLKGIQNLSLSLACSFALFFDDVLFLANMLFQRYGNMWILEVRGFLRVMMFKGFVWALQIIYNVKMFLEYGCHNMKENF
uniref:Uncharacterized protein n=1 Tax=Solanum tuberosum TaxID=4113 RepID=M0ZL24_SOLTU